MYSTKEKLNHFRQLQNPFAAEADLLLLTEKAPGNTNLTRYTLAPNKNGEDILFELLDVCTHDEIVLHRREFFAAKVSVGDDNENSELQATGTEFSEQIGDGNEKPTTGEGTEVPTGGENSELGPKTDGVNSGGIPDSGASVGDDNENSELQATGTEFSEQIGDGNEKPTTGEGTEVPTGGENSELGPKTDGVNSGGIPDSGASVGEESDKMPPADETPAATQGEQKQESSEKAPPETKENSETSKKKKGSPSAKKKSTPK